MSTEVRKKQFREAQKRRRSKLREDGTELLQIQVDKNTLKTLKALISDYTQEDSDDLSNSELCRSAIKIVTEAYSSNNNYVQEVMDTLEYIATYYPDVATFNIQKLEWYFNQCIRGREVYSIG